MPVDDMAFYVFAGCCYVGVPLLLTELVAAVVSAVRDRTGQPRSLCRSISETA